MTRVRVWFRWITNPANKEEERARREDDDTPPREYASDAFAVLREISHEGSNAPWAVFSVLPVDDILWTQFNPQRFSGMSASPSVTKLPRVSVLKSIQE